MTIKVLDLFSGIGGFSLGLERAGMETVAFCEIEPFCQKVLAKHWPDVPIYDDVRELTKEKFDADGTTTIDLICGGYPCQPFSHAGKRGGAEDDRHLWPEMYRLIETIRPRWVIAENVAGHISMGLDDVLADLEAANYTWWTCVIPACAVDAKHRRDRVWIVANSRHTKPSGRKKPKTNYKGCCAQRIQAGNKFASPCSNMADTTIRTARGICEQRQGQGTTGGNNRQGGRHYQWPTEPAVGRVANGVPQRVDRLKSLGNAVVPQIPEIIGRAIMEADQKS